jgi:phage gp45-like
MIRAIVTSCVEGVIKRLSAMGLCEITSREYMQHYGFTSIPKPGAEVIMVADGNHIVAIASDDRRYRLAVTEGEVALYDWRGQRLRL